MTQRKLVQWVMAYLAAAWLMLQVLDIIGDAFEWPGIVQQGAVVVLAFGLLVTVIVAWYHGERGHQRVKPSELLLVAGVCLAAAATLAYLRSRVAEPDAGSANLSVAAAPAAALSLAVLPFADLSPEGRGAYFADGLAEELISLLSRIQDLDVAARTSSFAYRDSALTIRDIGERLGVGHVVEGSVRRQGDRLRVAARLIAVSDGYRLWDHQYDGEASDVFQVQQEIARSIATSLDLQLRGSSGAFEIPGQTTDPEAQDLYMQGRWFWNLRTRAALESAVQSFEQAVRRDSLYARAFAGLGDALAVLGFYDFRPPRLAFPAAQRAAERALRLAPSMAEPYATLGYVALYHDWDWEAAESNFLKALQLDPKYPVAHQWYANYLTAMGRFAEAESEILRAVELDPLSNVAHAAVGWVLYHAGRAREGVAQLDRTLARAPQFELAYWFRGHANELSGNLDAAAADFQRAVDLSGGSAISRAALARVTAKRGDSDGARRLLDELSRDSSVYRPPYEIARAMVALGNTDRALELLRAAYADRSHSMAFLAVDPMLAPLRGTPEFEVLRTRLGLAYPEHGGTASAPGSRRGPTDARPAPTGAARPGA